MNEEITFAVNDTTRAILEQIKHLEKWRENNQKCHQDTTDVLLEHLNICKLLSLEIVESDEYPK